MVDEIEFGNSKLDFICHLLFEIWDFISFASLQLRKYYNYYISQKIY